MKKVLLVANSFYFFDVFERSNIKILQSLGYEVILAANGSSKRETLGDHGQLDDLGLRKIDLPFSRNPLNLSTLKLCRKLKKFLVDEHIDLIFTHTAIPSVLIRFAAKKLWKKGLIKIIYMAHGFHFYRGGSKKVWMLYYPIERYCSKFTDVLITINHEDYLLAQSKFHAKKTLLVDGVGLDFNKLKNEASDPLVLREELGIAEDDIMILSVGELNKNKNHTLVLKAIAEINNPHLHYVICGAGNEKENLIQQATEAKLQGKLHLMGFRTDIARFNKAADIFCFPSFREGLPISPLEAMALGKPVLISKIRGLSTFLSESENGFTFKSNSLTDLILKLKYLIDNPLKREEIGKRGQELASKFDINVIDVEMRKVFQQCILNEKDD